MKLSASGTARAMKCAPSTVLPHIDTITSHGTRGTDLHAFLMRVPKLGREKALSMVPLEHRAGAAKLDLERLPLDADAYAAEVAFAYSIENGTARELARGVSREEAYEGINAGEFGGMFDVVGLTAEMAIVFDYKSGHADLGPVVDNWQMRVGALMACRTYGRGRARVIIIRLKEDGDVFYDEADLDELDIDATEVSLQELRAKASRQREILAAGGQLDLVLGEHCKYCPALPYCPAQMGLLRQVVILAAPDEPQEPGLIPAVLTDENAPLVYARLKAAQAVLDRVQGSLKEFARIRPIDIGDGYVYGAKQQPADRIDPDKAVSVLVEYLGPEFAELVPASVVVKRSFPKEALKDLVRVQVQAKKKGADGKRITQKAAFDAAWQVLVEKEAASTFHSERVMEFKPKHGTPEQPPSLAEGAEAS